MNALTKKTKNLIKVSALSLVLALGGVAVSVSANASSDYSGSVELFTVGASASSGLQD